MAIVSTKAIVLSSIKYGDSSLIVKVLTEEEGVKSYLIRGVLKSKKGKLKPAYFQPLTQLQITANHNFKNTLNSIKEARVLYPYESVYTSVVKQTIVLFLSEILSSIIQEQESNKGLYAYIETSLIWFDSHQENPNFHLLFLFNLSRFLGFYPDMNQEKQFFSLMDGRFIDSAYQKDVLKGQELISFKKLLGTNFDGVSKLSFSKLERQKVLRTIIRYFELHLLGFKHPKSLDVLEMVFS